MKPLLSFFVPGIPAPGGSKRGFVNVYTGRVNIVDDCKRNRDWKAVVATKADEVMRAAGLEILTFPLVVKMDFYMPRPKGHYRTGQHSALIRPSFIDAVPDKKPDVLKLARSTEDALKGIVWRDDCQTIDLHITKDYGRVPGCIIDIWKKGAVLNAANV